MKKQIIFITGCSSGIGLDAVFALKERGHRVIGSCRKEEDVRKLLSQGIEAIQMDVADSSSIEMAFAEVLTKTSGQLDVLINNAGYGQAGALEDISRDVLRSQFETNVFGLVELTNLAIPIMRQKGKGRIINVSSILGIISMPFRGAYNASKYAVEGVSDTLRLELTSSGIHVITVEPGPIESRFRENCIDSSKKNLNTKKSYFSQQYERAFSETKPSASIFTKNTDAVIKKFIHAIESKNPKAKYPVTMPAYFMIFLKRILSAGMLDKFLMLISKKEMSK